MGRIAQRVAKITYFGLKAVKGFGKRAAQPYPIFLEVPPV